MIAGDFLGTDVTGTTALGNSGDGVHILDASNNTIGPDNVISANAIAARGAGVSITGPQAVNNRVINNNIGTNRDSSAVLGNGRAGVYLAEAAHNNIIGSGNVISGNGFPPGADPLTTGSTGVYIFGAGTTGNWVTGNLIGTDRSGNHGLTGALVGVLIYDAPGNLVRYNTISGNQWAGVELASDATPGDRKPDRP